MKKLLLVTLISSFITSAQAGIPTTIQCEDLSEGESLVVHSSWGKSKTGLSQDYTLVRKSEAEYEAYLNLDFFDKKLSTSEKKSVQLEEDKLKVLRAGIQRCYSSYRKLTDERGRTIVLKLYDKDLHQDIPEPQKRKIDVSYEFVRSNMGHYWAGLTCGEILHEGFHMLGLIDEYQEQTKRLNPNILKRILGHTHIQEATIMAKPAFDCRSPGPRDSLMGDNYYFGKLYSGHMNVVIYPNCKERNDIYFTCMKNAYRTSKKNGNFLGCKKTMDVCKTTDWVKTTK